MQACTMDTPTNYHKKLLLLEFICVLFTVYWEIFASLYFHKFRKFCSVAKLNFEKMLPATPFVLPMWIICENILREIIEIAIFAM